MSTRCYAFVRPDQPRLRRRGACEMSARRCGPAGQLLFLEHVRDEDPRIAKEQDNPAVPLLLDEVPSEPSHPGRDHAFEAVRRGRSPWCGPEGTP